MNSVTPKPQKVELSVQFPIEPWNFCPGKWIAENQKHSHKPDSLFKQFVTKKIPAAQGLLVELNNAHCLSRVHLPMRTSLIFFTYVSEQIELYQNQRDTRDFEIDQKFQRFKEAFAEERYKLCTNPEWATTFFADLKSRLMLSDALAPDFDKVATLWLKLMGVAHIGDMYLSSFFHDGAKTHSLSSSSNIKWSSFGLVPNDIQSSFHLVLKQLIQDSKWVCVKLNDKMFFPEDAELQATFFAAIGEYKKGTKPKEFQLPQIYRDAPSVIQKNFQDVLQNLLMLNFNDNKAVEHSISRLINIVTHIESYKNLTENIKVWDSLNFNQLIRSSKENPDKDNQVSTSISDVKVLMEKRQECHQLMNAFFIVPCQTLTQILLSFKEFNEKIQGCKSERKIPQFVAKSILPAPVRSSAPKFDAKICQELMNSSAPRKNTPKTPPKKTVEEKNCPVDFEEEPVSTAIPEELLPTPLISPLIQLRNRLLNVYQAYPYVSVRQSLWHLDALISLQDAVQASEIMKEQSLGILNMAANSAHKLLEQTYRFQLEKANIQTLSSHDLKAFYRAANNNSSYPSIVRELFHANHWTRYFILEKAKWCFTTHTTPTPPLLADLVNLAEGKPLQEKVQLKQRVEDIIEKTRVCVEGMLPHLSTSLPITFMAEDYPLELKTPLNSNIFNQINNSLIAIQKKSQFPSNSFTCLSLKQGIASISMLKASLQKIQQAKNYRELATWTSQCVQQAQESMENILHAIEYLKFGQASTEHELKILAKKVDLDMGPFGDDCHQLSYKPRYPAENINSGLGAQIIDDVEALRQHPECSEGFKLVGPTPLLWNKLNENLSAGDIITRLESFLKNSVTFLHEQALPALVKASHDKAS